MSPQQFFKMLSDETRLRCLILIVREGQLCVCELTAALQISQPKISRHLAQLRQSGLLKDTRHGQWVYYRLSDELPEWMKNIVLGSLSDLGEQAGYQADLTRLNTMGERPCAQRNV